MLEVLVGIKNVDPKKFGSGGKKLVGKKICVGRKMLVGEKNLIGKKFG